MLLIWPLPLKYYKSKIFKHLTYVSVNSNWVHPPGQPLGILSKKLPQGSGFDFWKLPRAGNSTRARILWKVQTMLNAIRMCAQEAICVLRFLTIFLRQCIKAGWCKDFSCQGSVYWEGGELPKKVFIILLLLLILAKQHTEMDLEIFACHLKKKPCLLEVLKQAGIGGSLFTVYLLKKITEETSV